MQISIFDTDKGERKRNRGKRGFIIVRNERRGIIKEALLEENIALCFLEENTVEKWKAEDLKDLAMDLSTV